MIRFSPRTTALFVVFATVAIVVVGLSLPGPTRGEAFDAAIARVAGATTVAGVLRVETLVPAETLGVSADAAAWPRLPLGITGPFRLRVGNGESPVFAAELTLALEGGETLPGAPGADILLVGDGMVYVRTRDIPSSAGMNVDMSAVNGRWMRLPAQEAGGLLHLSADRQGGGIGAGAAGVVDTSDTNGDSVEIDAAMPTLHHVLASMADGTFRAVRRIGTTTIDGIEVVQYRLAADPDRFLGVAVRLQVASLGRALTADEFARLAVSLSSFSFAGEAWVAEGIGEPRLVQMTFDLRPVPGNPAAPLRVSFERLLLDTPVHDAAPAATGDLLDVIMRQMLAPNTAAGSAS